MEGGETEGYKEGWLSGWTWIILLRNVETKKQEENKEIKQRRTKRERAENYTV